MNNNDPYEHFRIQYQIASQYNNNPLSYQTCLNQRPQVPCNTPYDCLIWVHENCAAQDQQLSRPTCDNNGMCVFDKLPN